MGDLPLAALFLPPLVVATILAMIAVLFFGGRGVLWLIGGSFCAIAGYLFWGFGLGGIPMSTGMEGLALVLFGVWWAVGAVWSGLIYLFGRLCRVLPDQRAGRREK